MLSAKEIITIQAGKFSNTVGSHWWNLQESSFCYIPDSVEPLDIDHDILFREGINFQGETIYTPRLLLLDLVENSSGIRQKCSVFKDVKEENIQTWEGSVEVIKQPTTIINSYLEDDADPSTENKERGNLISDYFTIPVKQTSSWSNILRTNLHPGSCILYQNFTSSEKKNPELNYSYGEEIYSALKEEAEDHLRKMAEDCDFLQGFQILTDGVGAFSSVTTRVLHHLADEYRGRDVICFPLYAQDDTEIVRRQYSSLYSISAFKNFSSFFSPLTLMENILNPSPSCRKFPFIDYETNEAYHSSAIIAAAIETLTAPYRLRQRRINLDTSASFLATYGRKLVCSSMCLPFKLMRDSYLSRTVERDEPDLHFVPLTPFFETRDPKTLLQLATLRGITSIHNFGETPRSTLTPEEVFGQFLNKYLPCSVTTACVLSEPITISPTFPSILQKIDSNKLGSAGAFSNSDWGGIFLSELCSGSDGRHFRDYALTQETTFDRDEFAEVLEDALVLRDAYESYSWT